MKAKSISTAGLGFDFVAPEGVKEPKPEKKRVLKDFCNHPNDEMTSGETLENVLTDFEALGNGYFEVVRNRFGAGWPTVIYHIPAVTMRVRKDKKGFVQQRDNRMVYAHRDPPAALKESINESAYAYTDKHADPKEEVGKAAPARTAACAP